MILINWSINPTLLAVSPAMTDDNSKSPGTNDIFSENSYIMSFWVFFVITVRWKIWNAVLPFFDSFLYCSAELTSALNSTSSLSCLLMLLESLFFSCFSNRAWVALNWGSKSIIKIFLFSSIILEKNPY